MNKVASLLLSIVVLIFLDCSTYGQLDTSRTREPLSALTGPVDCELALKYLDDAIDRASSTRSILIVVFKTKKRTPVSVVMTRSRGLRLYAQHRGHLGVEATVDFVEARAEQLDIYLLGKRLYTIPIKSGGAFDPMRCWVKGY